VQGGVSGTAYAADAQFGGWISNRMGLRIGIRRTFYQSAAWRRTRRQALHDAGYVCQECKGSLIGKGKGAHVHHRKEYKRAPALGLEPQNLVALCIRCHNIEHNVRKIGKACDLQGFATDRRHPWYAGGEGQIVAKRDD
jgi:hypothetical protein